MKKEIGNWVETINELLVGARVGYDPADIGDVQFGRVVADAIVKFRPITESVASVAQPLMPIASVAASKTPVGKVAAAAEAVLNVTGALQGVHDTNEQNSDLSALQVQSAETLPTTEASAKLSFDGQLEAVKKLKALLDEGILTEEEFEAKKHDIMGI